MSGEQHDGDGAINAISFGSAGKLYRGIDAEVLQGCDAIMAAYNGFVHGPDNAGPKEYGKKVGIVEARAEIIARLPSASPAEIKAKVGVVLELARTGTAGYAYRILAGSLAADVLEAFKLDLSAPQATRLAENRR